MDSPVKITELAIWGFPIVTVFTKSANHEWAEVKYRIDWGRILWKV